MNFRSYCEKENKLYLLDEWDENKNTNVMPETINHTSSSLIWWKCEKGHMWRTQLKSRSTSLTRCPVCNQERLEKIRKSRLK